MAERITDVAIRDGATWHLPAPYRHHDVIRLMAIAGREPSPGHCQGFLTDAGRFVDRIEALQIATDAGQVREKNGSPSKLFSEDLW